MKVIGLTGTIGAGKEVIVDYLKRKYSCWYVSLSSIIRAELEKKKKDFNRKTLQDLGNEMRKKYGKHILAKLATDFMQKNRQILIVDGIRNDGEADYLRKTFKDDFILIAVDAPREIRFERTLKRGRPTDPKTFEEFLEVDERDQGKNEPEYGQQVRKCIEMADIVFINDGTIEEFEKEIDKTLSQIKI
ncbi:MAG: AAA family ATPase [Candidatus Aenigmatarchaeota archaeon]